MRLPNRQQVQQNNSTSLLKQDEEERKREKRERERETVHMSVWENYSSHPQSILLHLLTCSLAHLLTNSRTHMDRLSDQYPSNGAAIIWPRL